MKYEGLKQVKSVIYPNNYVQVKKSSKILSYIMINLSISLTICLGILLSKFIGGNVEKVIETISQGIAGSGLFIL